VPLPEAEVRELLRGRLVAASLVGVVIQGGLAALQLGREGFGPAANAGPSGVILLAQGAVGAAAAWLLLRLRPRLSLAGLRAEAVLFGLPVVWLCYYRYSPLTVGLDRPFDGPDHQALFVQFAALRSNLQWFGLMLVYALFIPNAWQRCVAAEAAFSAALLGITVAAGLANPVTGEQMPFRVAITALLLTMIWPIAVYGSFKLSTPQREVSAARRLGQYRLRQRLGAGGMGRSTWPNTAC
jgi:hypothetical protein